MPVRNDRKRKERETSARLNYVGSPCQSDVTILATVEDLINMAMGPAEANTVNFKMLQAILHILARQMRMLEQDVELRVAEEEKIRKARKKSALKVVKEVMGDESESSSESDTGRRTRKGRSKTSKVIVRGKSKDRAGRSSSEERDRRKGRKSEESDEKDRAKLAKMTKEERYIYEKEMEEKRKAKRGAKGKDTVSTETKRDEKVKTKKEKKKGGDEEEKAMMANMNEQERQAYQEDKIRKERRRESAKKERERDEEEDAMMAKMNEQEREAYRKDKRDKERERARKQREKDEAEEEAMMAKMNEHERESYLKDRKNKENERAKNEQERHREEEKAMLAKMSDKEREAYENDKREREKARKERDEEEEAMMAKMNEKEREAFEKERRNRAIKEREEDEEALLSKLGSKEREEYEQARRKRDRERAKRERGIDDDEDEDMLEKMDEKERQKYLKEKERKRDENEKAMLAKMSDKERAKYLEEKERERDENEKAMLAKMSDKEREMYKEEKAKLANMSEEERAKYLEEKERERYENEKAKLAKMSDKEREMYKEEKAKLANMSEKERAKYLKEKEREGDENEKAMLEKMSEKERTKYLKEKEKEKALLAKMSDKERKIYEKEKAKLAKMSDKERAQYEKEKEKRDKEETAKLAKMSKKEREIYEKEKKAKEIANLDDGESDRASSLGATSTDEDSGAMLAKEQAMLAKMTEKEREKYKAEKEKEKKEKAKLPKSDAKVKDKYGGEKQDNEYAKLGPEVKVEGGTDEDLKLSKMNPKERAKYEKEKEKRDKEEKAKIAKMEPKERAEYEKEKEKLKKEQDKAKTAKDKGGISVKEKDSVLVVEKGPTTRGSSRIHRVGSIEVVTLSQFELLKKAVRDLEAKAGPVPYPQMPDNKKLRADISKGRASLTDTMQAMQVSARVQAAEAAIGRMAGLLTQLAMAGALPRELASQVADVTAEIGSALDMIQGGYGGGGGGGGGGGAGGFFGTDASSKGMGKSSQYNQIDFLAPSSFDPSRNVVSGTASAFQPSIASRSSRGRYVTRDEMDDALRGVKNGILNNNHAMVMVVSKNAENACTIVKHISEKMDMAEQISGRLEGLYNLVSDYAEQLAGFDAGISTQMQNFTLELTNMKNELNEGTETFLKATNNSETEAVLELGKRYEDLVTELELTLHTLGKLNSCQDTLGDQLKSLIESVEMLREQKSDRDEVLDALRDKADISRLDGMMREQQLLDTKRDLEMKLDMSLDKFRRQELVWMGALRDMSALAEAKASSLHLENVVEHTEDELSQIKRELQLMAVALGEPKAALLTRRLSKDATCGPCRIPALQELTAECLGRPHALPAMRHRHRSPDPGEVCKPVFVPPALEDLRKHVCHRWVGGSHTLINKSVVHKEAPAMPNPPPVKKYVGAGDDGKAYKMEKELYPCAECNELNIDPEVNAVPSPVSVIKKDGAAGDSGVKKTTLVFSNGT